MTKELLSLSTEKFNEIFESILDDTDVSEIMSIPGVREIVQEHFNNDVIEKWEAKYPASYFRLPKAIRTTIEIELGKDPEDLPNDIFEQWRTLRGLSREEMISHLTDQCIQVEESDPFDVLRDALLDSVCNGDVQL